MQAKTGNHINSENDKLEKSMQFLSIIFFFLYFEVTL